MEPEKTTREFNVECPWCCAVNVVTLEFWIDEETGQPRSAFRNIPEQMEGLRADWVSHAELRAALLTGQIEAPAPPQPGWPVGELPPS
jgi:hypothetical protein